MGALISIIVPIYKVELYLDKCINSIVNQTYKNLEIILIDDGSPDHCPQICDVWAKKDHRIKVVHKTNGGLSDARNTGLKIAKGEYIGFVDGDDWIDKYMYERLIESILKNKSDISCGSVEIVDEKSLNTKLLTNKVAKVLNNEEAMRAIIIEDDLKQPVWYKLYRATVIDGLFFKVGKVNEDNYWSYQAIANANSVSLIPDVVYFYMQHQGSIMNSTYSLRRLDGLEAKYERNVFLKNKYPKLYFLGCENLFYSCIYEMQMSLKYLKNNEKKIAIKSIKNYLKTTMIGFKNQKSLKNKLWFIMYEIDIVKTCKLRNLLKIGF